MVKFVTMEADDFSPDIQLLIFPTFCQKYRPPDLVSNPEEFHPSNLLHEFGARHFAKKRSTLASAECTCRDHT